MVYIYESIYNLCERVMAPVNRFLGRTSRIAIMVVAMLGCFEYLLYSSLGYDYAGMMAWTVVLLLICAMMLMEDAKDSLTSKEAAAHLQHSLGFQLYLLCSIVWIIMDVILPKETYGVGWVNLLIAFLGYVLTRTQNQKMILYALRISMGLASVICVIRCIFVHSSPLYYEGNSGSYRYMGFLSHWNQHAMLTVTLLSISFSLVVLFINRNMLGYLVSLALSSALCFLTNAAGTRSSQAYILVCWTLILFYVLYRSKTLPKRILHLLLLLVVVPLAWYGTWAGVNHFQYEDGDQLKLVEEGMLPSYDVLANEVSAHSPSAHHMEEAVTSSLEPATTSSLEPATTSPMESAAVTEVTEARGENAGEVSDNGSEAGAEEESKIPSWLPDRIAKLLYDEQGNIDWNRFFTNRIEIWKAYTGAFNWIGHPAYGYELWGEIYPAHNLWIGMIYRYGWIGGILFVLTSVILLVKNLWKGRRIAPDLLMITLAYWSMSIMDTMEERVFWQFLWIMYYLVTMVTISKVGSKEEVGDEHQTSSGNP
ncbi:MAG: hypothetical protein K6C69_06880 [Lachnospiraceae bacterium]|nr:hypothetical protein [Lachnospiraceae bacterium]